MINNGGLLAKLHEAKIELGRAGHAHLCTAMDLRQEKAMTDEILATVTRLKDTVTRLKDTVDRLEDTVARLKDGAVSATF